MWEGRNTVPPRAPWCNKAATSLLSSVVAFPFIPILTDLLHHYLYSVTTTLLSKRTSTFIYSSSRSSAISLTSGKFQLAEDKDGRVFIDRNGKLFAPILAYLRSNRLIVDEGVSLERVLDEAQFYQIDGLETLLQSKASSEKEKELKGKEHVVSKRGYYSCPCDADYAGDYCIQFLDNERCVISIGEHAVGNLYAFNRIKTFFAESARDKYAQIVVNSISRDTYKLSNNGGEIIIPHTGLFGVVKGSDTLVLALFGNRSARLPRDSFLEMKFTPWD
eukprot:TRINITY_DN683_c0_g1_i2.p1 TRINITY_DN683_c0_g1~~TRINITY_DN683_c0_g1_i2.p1  ORF type:complete len:276 (-),score=25.66 TRINITY_DN683_c0_g1_i2:54-881(-)